MARTLVTLAGCLYLLVLAACTTQPQEQPPASEQSMQIAWGTAIYQQECARCHDPGRVARELVAARLILHHNAHRLFEYNRQYMPLDKPGALRAQDYWDVTAYTLAREELLPSGVVLGRETAEQIDFTFR